MYHPDMMLNIAHMRETELIRDAELCGVPQPDGYSLKLPRQLAVALICVIPFVILAVWVVVYA